MVGQPPIDADNLQPLLYAAGVARSRFDLVPEGSAQRFSAGGSAARMRMRRLATHVEVLAPAKINLFLEVIAKRPDGYHELETVLVAVTLYDTLRLWPRADDLIELDCRWGVGMQAREAAAGRPSGAGREPIFGELPRGPDNLAWHAVARLRAAAGISNGAQIELVKRIPAAAGLGGASSDAAAALVAAHAAWNLRWPRERLTEIAAELGSDVPFFLTRGAAVCRGRGERMTPLPATRLHIVLARPPSGLSTRAVFEHCRPVPAPRGSAALVQELQQGHVAAAARSSTNGLQAAAASLTPWINTLEDEFQEHGLIGHQMSGSGSSYFGLCRTARQARRIAARLRARQIGAVYQAASTAS